MDDGVSKIISRNEMDRLLQASKTIIISSHQFPAIVQTASSLLSEVRTSTEMANAICEDFIQALRVLRNICAAGDDACATLLALGVIDLLADTIDALGAGAASLNWTLPAVVAQFLANFSNGSAACAAAAWHRLFPLSLITLAHIDACPAQEATSLALLTCCKSVPGAAEEIIGQQGAPILTGLLHLNYRLASRNECNHTLPILLGHLVFELDALVPLMVSLSTSGDAIVEVPTMTVNEEILLITEVALVSAHSLLLQEIAVEAQDVPLLVADSALKSTTEESGGGGEESASGSGAVENKERRKGLSMAGLVGLLKRLTTRPNLYQGGAIDDDDERSAGKQREEDGDEETEEKEEKSAGTTALQCLQDLLHLLRDICARDDDGVALTSQKYNLVKELLTAGLIPVLLALLQSLGPINNPRRPREQQKQQSTEKIITEVEEEEDVDALDELSIKDAAEKDRKPPCEYVTEQPYEGYRSDIVAIIANAGHKRKAVHEEVITCGGVELILSQCQVDYKSPLAREWALWAVRNLCQGSEVARNAIQELKACAAVDSEELRRAGVKVELDEVTGKLKVSKRE